jgi:CelD/BcsL family acetyltransferase involved in cellulose biosynthesis
MLETELIVDETDLVALAPAWDALAVANRQPLAGPAWMLGAWRHLRPAGAELRAVAVREDGDLVAIAPFFAERRRGGRIDYRLLGGAMPRTGPLARPGCAWEAAAAVGAALAAADPRPDVVALEAGPHASPWPLALRERWPARVRPPLRQYYVQPSPTVALGAGSFDAWLAGKSANFRGQMRRMRRQLAAAGGTVRASTPATLHEDVATFLRLHAGRWEGKGASAIVAQADGWRALYEEVGAAQLETGRMRLYLLELDGEPISAQLFAAAGGEAIHLNGGWDERHAKLKPSLLGIVAGLEDAFARGDRRLDLGPGEQAYKLRLADGNDPVAWSMVVVPRARMGLTLARVTPTVARIAARETAKRALTDEQADRLRALRRRLTA